jgi:hypothetical protein
LTSVAAPDDQLRTAVITRHSLSRPAYCRAQNRYREKQKAKTAAAEREYADTAAELERARFENLRLREQQTTMQQVLSVRESAMDMLQSGKVRRGARGRRVVGC